MVAALAGAYVVVGMYRAGMLAAVCAEAVLSLGSHLIAATTHSLA